VLPKPVPQPPPVIAPPPPVSTAPPPPRVAAPPPPVPPVSREPIIAEPPPPPAPAWSFDLEQFVGVRLFSAVAGIALVFAGVFFLRYSIDQGWLQPRVRVVIGILVAIALLVVCDRKAARKYALLANAMDGAAIAILFATFFAAHSLWNLISGTTAFGLLALVTLTAVMLSIRHESLFIAVLGLLGGFATPMLLSTGENRPISLFTYLLLLNIGLAWVAYRNRWPILSILTLAFTTIYQWGWVARYLDAAQVPLAIAIFSVFPVVGYGVLMVARSRVPGEAEEGADNQFEWTMLAAAVLPVAFAVYLATSTAYRDQYALVFGWIALIDVALLALAIARSNEALHGLGAVTTVIAVVMWTATSYVQGAVFAVIGFVALFNAIYLAAPVIANRFGKPFTGVARHATLAAPLLLLPLALMIDAEPRAESPAVVFPALLVLVLAIAWRAMTEPTGRLYYIAAVIAVFTFGAWTGSYLTPATVFSALAIHAAFTALYLGVPHVARRHGAPLGAAAGPGAILLLAQLALMVFVDGEVAARAVWGLALLLMIINAGVFLESAIVSRPVTAFFSCLISWFVLFGWWLDGAAAVGLLSSLLVVVSLSLVMVGGHFLAIRYTAPSDEGEPRTPATHGLWLALLGQAFLLAVASNRGWVVPPWPLFAALTVVTLAFSTAALAARNAPFHFASMTTAAVIVMVWGVHTQQAGYAATTIAAFGVLSLFALAWIAVMPRFAQSVALAAVAVIVISEINLMQMMTTAMPASLPVAIAAHVIGFVILLALVTRYGWENGASAAAALGGLAAGSILLPAAPAGRDVLIYAGVIYLPFAIYPLVLGSRARDNRDPYVAALIAGAWCFLIARRGMALANLDWMVGIVPVLIGAITTLHLSQLLRIEPKGQRDLGRLALVAGAALAFLTVAIPLQLRQQWITIGWALEGAAVAWLYTRIPHRGLLLAAVGLLGAVFVRLALNPSVFVYEPRGEMRIINWYLYTYVVAAVAMGVAAWFLAKTDDRLADSVPRPRHLLPAAAGILMFLLLNIEIADYYSTGPEILFRFGSSIQQDLTYTIAWLIFGIITLAVGIIWKVRPARVTAVALIAITAFKCFLYDLGSLGGLYRVGAFVGLAVSLALVSMALQKYVLAPEKEPAL
jgi:uncharacterized membrane protein